jgi:hypothetical protein
MPFGVVPLDRHPVVATGELRLDGDSQLALVVRNRRSRDSELTCYVRATQTVFEQLPDALLC